MESMHRLHTLCDSHLSGSDLTIPANGKHIVSSINALMCPGIHLSQVCQYR